MTEASPKNVVPRAVQGPNGLVEIRQFNAAQGWHSGYMTPADAIKLADEIRKVAEGLSRDG